MITYILESLAFQLLFLLTYDLFLKKETFFQWNRAYLLATFVLSILLPWIKIEALQTTMPKELETTTVFLTQLDGVVLGPDSQEVNFLASVPWPYLVMAIGAILAALWFVFKLLQLGRLKSKSKVEHYPDYTKVIMPQSTSAFSFFRSIFMGAQIKKDNEANILAHEMVHVKQKHTLDLLFFELARIVFWFNPLVYIYQYRVAELHEFIADEKAVKQNKQAHFEMLLSEAFHTQNISFVNQFFTKSLIKKRIVMLQKKKSKAVWQLKYVLLMPLVLGMLIYTSCETKSSIAEELSLEERLAQLNVEIEAKDSLTLNEMSQLKKMARNMLPEKSTGKKAISLTPNSSNPWKVSFGRKVSFSEIDEVPVFPGCEDADDKRACFQEKIQEHIRKNFNYPEEAQEQGIQGRVDASFSIDEQGNVSHIQLLSPYRLLKNESRRILDRLPKMQPGKHEGKIVQLDYSIPITFVLEGGANEKKFQPFKSGNYPNMAFGSIDEVPIFPGCEGAPSKRACFESAIMTHIRKNFNYPEAAREQGIEGKVNTVVSIGVEGDVVDIQFMGEAHELLKNEVERILTRLPKMQAGKYDGKPAIISYSIPIVFKLDAVKQESYDQETKISVPFATIDEVPVFPGCEDAVDKRKCFNEKIVEHIKKHFNYPEEAKEKGVQGRVSVVFTIDANGEISTIKKRGPDVILENEAERIIKRLPKMQPGKHKGETVKVPFAIPITFRLPTQSGNSSANNTKDYMLVNASKINRRGKVFYEGTVTDKESLGLSGVTISIDRKESGVLSNFNGVFSIEVEDGDVLKFQYIGLPNKLIRIPMN
ncbi:hypothetical protein MACH07_15960 [Flagellimonas marinaquae]|uniref:TonB C-terminal domain-containing protein n=1 Tax=Flagellimonas marinaquae TaxID=254955 RepID=A0AA48KM36_9FLAO|nr:hypothetical protein MACH07_15960 [Allomuricauda aquimarina]